MAKSLTQFQFRAFPHAARPSGYDSIIEEHEWYSDDEESTLGIVLRDKIDQDWGYVVLQLGRDSVFRCVAVDSSLNSAEEARVALMAELERASEELKEYGAADIGANLARSIQPHDPFVPVVPPAKFNPLFAIVANMDRYSPAKQMIREVFSSYKDRDGNFIEQFQTTGFDARIWELYLHAYFIDGGFSLLPTKSPDYIVSKRGARIGIEAVTVNPTQLIGTDRPNPHTSTRLLSLPSKSGIPQFDGDFVYKEEDFVPIKLGGALYTKSRKGYWDLPGMDDIPVVFAIETFHEEGSLFYSSVGLATYLYGYRHSCLWDGDGNLVIVPQKVESHTFGGKTIPSGFFFQPGRNRVSAVLFSNSGTVSKFNRMGQQSSHYNPNLRLFRFGNCYDKDPIATEPLRFSYEVGDPLFREWWGQGLEMFHNPNASFPVDPSLFPDITHHRLVGELVSSEGPAFHPIASMTINFFVEPSRKNPLLGNGARDPTDRLRD